MERRISIQKQHGLILDQNLCIEMNILSSLSSISQRRQHFISWRAWNPHLGAHLVFQIFVSACSKEDLHNTRVTFSWGHHECSVANLYASARTMEYEN